MILHAFQSDPLPNFRKSGDRSAAAADCHAFGPALVNNTVKGSRLDVLAMSTFRQRLETDMNRTPQKAHLLDINEPGVGKMHVFDLVVWLTGLSSAGKTTIAQSLKIQLHQRGFAVELLDGDVIRQTLSKDLGFGRADREENVRRIGFVASLLARNGIIVLVAAISPFRESRDAVRRICGRFVEVYVNAPLQVCEERDIKGLYRRARRDEISHVTGIDEPYEPPLTPEVECCTSQETIAESVDRVQKVIERYLHT